LRPEERLPGRHPALAVGLEQAQRAQQRPDAHLLLDGQEAVVGHQDDGRLVEPAQRPQLVEDRSQV
jgi:hypothetical protein